MYSILDATLSTSVYMSYCLPDAIPAQKAQSITYHRAVHGDIQHDDEDFENGIHSPRTNKVKRKAG